MGKWSEEAWRVAAPVYKSILELPFVKQLASGVLTEDKFIFYLRQDSLYIDGYAKILSHIASRLDDKSHVESFINFAMDGIAVEKAMHESFLQKYNGVKSEMSPSCLLYASILKAQATSPVEVEAAAVLPCFWIYQKVGQEILKRGIDKGNPYDLWIGTYGDPAFEASTVRAIEICDQLAERTGEETRHRMTDIFVLCSKMEWMFWDSAYNMEQWKI